MRKQNGHQYSKLVFGRDYRPYHSLRFTLSHKWHELNLVQFLKEWEKDKIRGLVTQTGLTVQARIKNNCGSGL